MGVAQNEAVVAICPTEERYDDFINDFLHNMPVRQKSYFAVKEIYNDQWSVICGPDGSGLGKQHSNEMREVRKGFVEYCKQNRWEYVHVTFGELGNRIVEL